MKNNKLILVGASTGGPGHLEQILSSLDADFSSTLIIAQHIDFVFMHSMVKHFDNICMYGVEEAQENKYLKDPSIIFTYKNLTNLEHHHANGLHLSECTRNSPYQPSVDSLFLSASKICEHYDILACLLTGIGDDGAAGLLALKNCGARCLSESKESCVVYGMPKAAEELGAVTEVMSLDEIIQEIKNF